MLTTTAAIALISMIPLVVVLCVSLPLRRAVLTAYLVGWLFLPQAVIPLPGALPDFGRGLAIGATVLAATLLLDLERVKALRPHWLDASFALWIASPFFASVTNGLGAYDGVSEMVNTTVRWGVPYVIGRVHFGDAKGLRMLAVGLVIGGLIYVPFCLYEARMSPQLHRMVYGFHQHMFLQTKRLGGWRPMVFMQHGLAVGMFMASAALLAVWLWANTALGRLQRVGALASGVLVFTTLACRSSGSILLLAVGGAALAVTRGARSRIPILVLALLPLTYAGVRTTGLWQGEGVVDVVARVNPSRANSLEFRLRNERILIEKAMQKPLFGWGGWGRYRVYDAQGRDISVTDGLWVIRLGKTGLVGLAATLMAFLLPIAAFARAVKPSLWARPGLAPASGLCAFIALAMIDNLVNAMFTPFAPMAMGALATFLQALEGVRRRMAQFVPHEGESPGLQALATYLEDEDPALARLLGELQECLDETQVSRLARLGRDEQLRVLRGLAAAVPPQAKEDEEAAPEQAAAEAQDPQDDAD